LLGLDDVLIGGKGNDTLSGEGGNDSLSGEEGDDILNGGDQNDTIAGGAGKDRIRGGAGSDSLGGDAGNDDLDGEAGTDRYSAGSGDDTLDSRDGEKDTIDCGTGVDSVDADLKDSVQDSCENLDQGAVKEGPNVRITSKSLRLAADGTARVRLHCPHQLHIRCRGSLALVRAGATKRTSGVARYAVRPGRSIAVRVRIGGADRRALKRGRKLSRRVRSVEHGTHGPKTTIRLVTVRA
jgi:Ca2+-binding RTX toxin-like protein